MQATTKKTFNFHVSASSLGGFIDTPSFMAVPSQASASLPTAGGHASVHRGAFNHHSLVSCRTSFTRVSGKPHGTTAFASEKHAHSGWTSQATCIVEGLNILQVVTADRIVAQISVEHPDDGGPRRYSFAGTHFEGLRVGGKEVCPTLNAELFGHPLGVCWDDFIKIGGIQADALAADKGASQWAKDSMDWMQTAKKPAGNGHVLCSLVDTIPGVSLGKSFANCVEVPGIGRFFFAELSVYHHAVQVTMVRAELGCHVNGQLSAASAEINGGCKPPC